MSNYCVEENGSSLLLGRSQRAAKSNVIMSATQGSGDKYRPVDDCNRPARWCRCI